MKIQVGLITYSEFYYYYALSLAKCTTCNRLVELKRIDVLLNKTREEVAKSYVTKDEMESSMDRVMRMLSKLETKLDKLFEVKTN